MRTSSPTPIAPTEREAGRRTVELARHDTETGQDAPDERVLERERRPKHQRGQKRHHEARRDRPLQAERSQPDGGRQGRGTAPAVATMS